MCNNMKNLFRHMLSKKSWKQEYKIYDPNFTKFRTGKTLCGGKKNRKEVVLGWEY